MPDRNSQQLEATREKMARQVDRVDEDLAPNMPVAKRQPLAHLAGSFKGEEWDALLEAVRRNRQSLDTQEADVE